MALKSPLINVMDGAARKAARVLVHDFGEVEQLQVSKKGPADFVSRADRRSERILREHLQKARPDFGFLLEEGGSVPAPDGRSRWIVDPLDGTTNFLHGIPHFAISIAAEQDGEIVAGLIHDPLRDETFWADRGQGAYLNERRLRVSGRQHLKEAVFATGIPHLGRGDHPLFLAVMANLIGEVAGVRRMGAASLDLAFVAAGRYDGFWEESLASWDIAAGILIVREAGGLVTDFTNRPSMMKTGEIVAANDKLHAPLLKILAKSRRGLSESAAAKAVAPAAP